MSITEADRLKVHQALKDVMSDDNADRMMEMLPPVGWGDIARREDLERVELALRKDIDRVETVLYKHISQVENSLRKEIIQLDKKFTDKFIELDKKFTDKFKDLEKRMDRLGSFIGVFATINSAAFIGLYMMIASKH